MMNLSQEDGVEQKKRPKKKKSAGKMDTDMTKDYEGWTKIERQVPFQGYRTYVASTYIGFNIVGFAINSWVLYVVAPLLFAPAIKVPKSILFFIFTLCVSDLMTMFAMSLLIIELVFGTWRFSSLVCTSYLLFDSMNKFVAPIIVFLISRTCYTTVCLDKRRGEKAASLKFAAMQVIVALGCVFTFHMNPNSTTMEVMVIRKCGFFPPPKIEFWFNLIACTISYAVPLFGIIYWYVSVPFFLKRRALNSLVTSNSMDTALRKVITTVFLLTAIYVVCWTPYWVSMFAHRILAMGQKNMIIISYFIHLLPYVSCVAYPLIFTLLNRGIRSAHARIVADQRRRFRSLTDEASSQIRTAIRGIPPQKAFEKSLKKNGEVRKDEISEEKLVNTFTNPEAADSLQSPPPMKSVSQLSFHNDETLL
ncbi:unnamed protein product [Caenorhabditis auriculariae]|uniref:G-protein coupled receptors family 1 profile domain-containing protein n=1 Tax=Caenorhabditis auriculariae TaxID=2777116 RepID=A0A8S1GQ64_9PELO|nr:unnamed protein product [Caenorhabditis auriculariae]